MSALGPNEVGNSAPRMRHGVTLAAVLAVLAGCGGPLSGRGAGAGAATDAPVDAQLLARFKSEAVAWIRSERARHRARAVPLSEEDRRRYSAYFAGEILDRVKVLTVDEFDNPDFFSIFEERGEPYPVDLRTAKAMALLDTILLSEAASTLAWRDRLIFHELVHVAQYEVLGLESYMEGYVDGWARNGRRYADIPHERQAFALARRFAAGGPAFSVESEVRSTLAPEIDRVSE